jgi:uncharacterized delta-60 repeat protein
MMKHALYLVLLQFLPELLLAQGGTLDNTFNTSGYRTEGIGNGDDNGNAVAIQPDGMIVVAGESHNGNDFDIAVVRFTYSGEPDNTFGTNGKVTVNLGNIYDTGKAVAIQDDGKILVAGSFLSNGGGFKMCLVRLNADGSYDDSFGANGIDSFSVGTGSAQANAITIQDDEKIIVAGSSTNGSNLDFTVVRLNSDGSMDAAFGSNGVAIIGVGNADDYANAVTLQSDNKIVAAGKSGNNPDIAVIRLNEDGTLDNSFSNDGKVTTNVNGNDNAFAVAIQTDGKIVVCGEAFDGVTYDVSVVRYTETGALDNSFSNDGKVTTALGSTYEGGYAIAVQQDAKILVCGKTSTTNTADNVALLRYNSDGTLDTGFGNSGKVSTDISGHGDASFGLVLQNDGAIVVAGYSNNGANNDFLVMRYLSGLNVGVGNEYQPLSEPRLFPNPVSAEAEVTYQLPFSGKVTVVLNDLSGKEVYRWLNNQHRPQGSNTDHFVLPTGLPAGEYLLRIESGAWSMTMRLMH